MTNLPNEEQPTSVKVHSMVKGASGVRAFFDSIKKPDEAQKPKETQKKKTK